MRKTLLALAILLPVAVAYAAWPIYSLVTLARAIEAGDVATVVEHVDFPAVRASLTQQLTETYERLTGKTVSPLLRNVLGVGGSIVEPVVGKLVTPEALTDFLRSGWPNAVVADRPAGTVGLSTSNLGTVWQLFGASDYGIRRFEIAVPLAFTPDRRFRFEFQLTQWRWRLVGVRIPQYLQVILVEALIKSLQQQQQR
jgi:hypothetical protein